MLEFSKSFIMEDTKRMHMPIKAYGPIRSLLHCVITKRIPAIYLSITPTNAHTYYLYNLKFTIKHLKRSYMFRSHDHPQGAYIVPC